MKKLKVSNSLLKVNHISVENKLHFLNVGGPGLLVTACQRTCVLTLTIWSVVSSEQITYKCQLDFPGIGDGVSIDLNYISVVLKKRRTQGQTVHFISTSTFTNKCRINCQLEAVSIDSNYISVSMWQDRESLFTYHFISTETLKIERSLSTRGYMPAYFLNEILALSNEKDCIR